MIYIEFTPKIQKESFVVIKGFSLSTKIVDNVDNIVSNIAINLAIKS